jgi:hypothetical protein
MDIRELLDRAGDTITVRRVFGEPYEKDGLVVIPAARCREAAEVEAAIRGPGMAGAGAAGSA